MPTYQFDLETDKGVRVFDVDLDAQERLGRAMAQIPDELKRLGFTLKAGVHGDFEVWRGGVELDLNRSLAAQGVQPNEKLRVRTKAAVIPPRQAATVHTPKKVMDLKRKIYFMALVGALAGLLCSALLWIPESFQLQQEQHWLLDPFVLVILGALIGALTVGFADYWLQNEVIARWVLSGSLIGLVAGLAGGFFLVHINASLQPVSPQLAVIVSWMVGFAFIGFGTGLRWVGANKNRALHALLGGLAGGCLGGIVFASRFGGDPDLSKTVGLMLAGVGITSGVTLAPVIFRSGTLTLINSASPTVRSSQLNWDWELSEGGQYLIGRLSARKSMGTIRPDVDVLIQDEMITDRHAYIVSHRKKFYIEPHIENKTPEGLPRYPLQLRGSDVTRAEELKDGDIVTVGQTLLRFESRKKPV